MSRGRVVKILICLALAVPLLAAPLHGTTPVAGAASGVMPTLSLTVSEATGRVTLRGRTHTSSTVLNVERYDRVRKRYIYVRKIRSSNHRFTTSIRPLPVTTAYRVRDLTQMRASYARWVRAAVDECGVQPAKWNGVLWNCSFHDNFSGTTLDTTKWAPQTEGFYTGTKPGSSACYRPDNVSVSGGSLRLVARHATLLECPGLTGVLNIFTAGMVSTYYKWSQRYGRFEARIKNTATDRKGLHEAFWLWPDVREVANNWPTSGEIDVSETYSVNSHLSVPFLHSRYDQYGNITEGKYANTAFDCVAQRGEWNTYRLEWYATKIRIYVNNKLCLVNTSADAAFKEKYIIAFTQGLGAPGNSYNILNPPPIPATMQVDYIRVWE